MSLIKYWSGCIYLKNIEPVILTKAQIYDLSQKYKELQDDIKSLYFLYIEIEVLISERLIPVGQLHYVLRRKDY